jgi:Dolichyl-phosphate-mannose-protein mannosyltransferase
VIARILLSAAFTVCVCLALGKALFAAMQLKLSRAEELFLGFNTGAACLSMLVFLLSVAHLAYAGIFLATGCAIIAAAILTRSIRLSGPSLDRLPRPWLTLFAILYFAAGLVYLAAAVLPESSFDANVYHVALPALYLREHHIPAITTNQMAALSEGMEMIYLFALSLGGDSAPGVVHLAFLLGLPWGILSYARRIGSQGAGVVAGMLFFLSPAVALDGTTAYVDVALASVIFAMFYVLEIWREERNDRLLVPAGLLAGFSYAIKYPGGLALVYMLGVILFHRCWRAVPFALVPALIAMAPWIAKDAIVWHNPVAPFANTIFANPYLYPASETRYRESVSGLGGLHVWQLPYDLTTRGTRTQAFIGPVFLLAPVALLALGTRIGRRVLAALAVFALVGLEAHYARFLFPALVFLCLALGLVLARWRLVAMGIVALHAIGAVPYVMAKYASRTTPRVEWPDLKAALRITPESDYLSHHLDAYDFGKLMDAKLSRGARVFSFQNFQLEYHSHPLVVEWQSALGVRLGEAIQGAINPGYLPGNRYVLSFPPTTARRMRLILSRPQPGGEWAVSELRFFEQGIEHQRAPEWRLRASPNPWDVQLAFDNSPLTKWATRRKAAPGMFVEVDFGATKRIDRVTIDSADQGIELALQADGRPVAAQTERLVNATPSRLRRAAIENLERENIQALAVHELDPGARDFLMRQEQWGIELAGTSGRYSLYRLK